MAKTASTKTNGATTKASAGITDKQFNLLAKHLNLYPKDLPRVYDVEKTRHKVRVDRKTAAAWVEKNFEGQRGISATRVRTLANKMKEGVWMPTPQGIVFDWYDRLIDGQHRLYAFLESGLPEIYVTVTTGSDPQFFLHLDEDVGSRHLKDLLTSGGMGNGGLISSAFRMLISYDTCQQKEDSDKGFISIGHVSFGKWKNNREEAMAWCLSHRAIVEHIAEKLASSDARSLLRPMSLFSGFYLWVALDDMERADEFFDKLITGVGLTATDPVYQLRRELLRIHQKVSEQRQRTQSFMHCAFLIKAWNAFIEGDTIRQLRFHVGENWPKRIGAKPVFKNQSV
jgi:hypothetical protein